MSEKPDDWGGDEKRVHPVLTNKEVAEARAAAKKRLETEQKKAAREKVEADELDRLKHEEGLVVGGVADEMVSITIDLAEFADKIVINGRPYWHAHTYTVPRHLGDTLREIMARGWQHQSDIDGKSKTAFYANKRVAELYNVKKGGAVVGPRDL